MLLKEILREDACTGSMSAGNFAGYAGSLFKGGIISWPKSSTKKKKAKIKVIKYNPKG